MKNWYKDWFNSELYQKIYTHRNKNDAELLINNILPFVDIPEDSVILDAACGNGRFFEVFRKHGWRVIGFDLSMPQLIKAKSSNTDDGVLLTRADIRNFYVTNKIKAVFNLFTSFGYFEGDEENFIFPKNAYQFLLPGGYYIFDYFNPSYLKTNLVKFSEKTIDSFRIREERDILDGRVVKNITIESHNQINNFIESVKLYDYNQIMEKFISIGFQINTVLGNYNGLKFDEKTSERLIIIFEK